jgi:fatty acid desaturase
MPAANPVLSNAAAAGPARGEIARLHAFDRWPARNLGPMQAALGALMASSAVAWQTPAHRPALLFIWPAYGYVLWQFTLAFHDASHGRFHPVHWVNEQFGHVAGTLSFVPLAVYRHAHARHHAYIGTPRDPELWPFTLPGTPRAVRVVAALGEVFLGFVYTPLLFLRGVMTGGLPRDQRRGVVAGYAASVCVWAAILIAVNHFRAWELFAVVGVVPLAIAGAVQTLNKYTQHLGLHGRSVLGLTRTVVDRRRYAAIVSSSMLHNDSHGTHHRYAKIPHYHLPAATPYALADSREPCPVFPSVTAAVLDMLPCLGDPKVGPQWVGESGREHSASIVRGHGLRP